MPARQRQYNISIYFRARDKLFKCQNKVLEKCPRAAELQAISGNDQSSMQNGIDVLCKDVNGNIQTDHFSSPVRMCRKSYCTSPHDGVGVGSGVDIGAGVGVSRILMFYV